MSTNLIARQLTVVEKYQRSLNYKNERKIVWNSLPAAMPAIHVKIDAIKATETRFSDLALVP